MARRPPKPLDRVPKPRYRKPKTPEPGQASPASKKETLARLSRAQVTTHELAAAMLEVLGTSDRTTCIVVTAMIERDLEDSIISRLNIRDEEPKKLLFDRDGALSTFYGNIRFGRALGFYDQSVQRQLDTIRRIRNVFAHSAIAITFTTEALKKN
jgi:hypothetical protein